MQIPGFFFSEAFANLKDLVIPLGHKLLHAQLRGGLKIPSFGLKDADMGFRCRRRDSNRGIHFKVSVLVKILADAS